MDGSPWTTRNHPPLPMEEGALLQHTPQKGGDGHRNSLTPSRPLKLPLWDIEVCTPTHDLKACIHWSTFL